VTLGLEAPPQRIRRAIPNTASAGIALAAGGVLMFSLSLPMTKIALRSMSPAFTAMGRAVIAGTLGSVALAVTKTARPTKVQVRRLLFVVGGVIFGWPLLLAYALHRVPSNHGAIVTGLLPLATAGFAVALAGERPSLRYWLCSLVGLLAVSAYALRSGGGSLHLADLLLLLAVIASAVGYAEGAKLARQMSGWRVISWALVIALPATIPAAIATSGGIEKATIGQLGAFAYIGVVSMFLGFFAWYAGLARAGIARGGQIQLAQPVLSLIWAWPMLGERPDIAGFLTAAIVIGAVAIGRNSVIR
jgi:drug/metabolite transporter (DMT)-like permease